MLRQLRTFALIAVCLTPVPAFAATDATETPAAAAPAGAMHGQMQMAPLGPLPASMQGKPLVVHMTSDSCASCTAMKPSMDRLKTQYGDKVNFVELNMSNAATTAAARAKAQKLGIMKFFDMARTNMASAVIDPLSGKIVMFLPSDASYTDYKKAIDRGLGRDLSS